MTAVTDKEVQSLQETLAERGVKYALASFVDLHGVPKAKAVPLAHLGQMLGGSELFTGAALDGVPQDVSDEEVSARPDPASATILPWNAEVAWFASDLHLEGAPFEACSRGILKRVMEEAKALGYTFNLGVETEFFVLRETEEGGYEPASPADVRDKPCYDVEGLLDNYGFLDELVEAMNGLGWDVYSLDHEDANGQFETDFMYADALTMADRFTFFRMMAKELAKKHGLFATFMPKPFDDRTGSGAHYNMSLADAETGANLFDDPKDPRGCGLSTQGYRFIAGVLRHAPAITAVIAPTVNSYKRLVRKGSMSGFTWAPVFVCYGNNNRTNMIRIPLAGGRVECRAADIAGNVYLGAAMMLAAGLEGIREDLDPGDPHTENMYHHTQAELDAMGVEEIPRTLEEAVAAFEADADFGRRVLGDAMFDAFRDYKRAEWADYHTHVSDWEKERYLKFF